jgi:hypothetical protein
MPQTFVLPRQVILADGLPASGAVAAFFQTGTTTEQAVYTDAALTVAVTSITADSAGVLQKVYINPNAAADYRVRITAANGTLIAQDDDIARQPFTQLTPQTQSEEDAGITPTNEGYEPGDINRYGTNTTPGTTNMTAALAAACLVASNGGPAVYIPAGTYLITSAVRLYSGITIYGDGDKSILKKTTDITVFDTDSATSTEGVVLKDFYILSTVTGATTKYDLDIINGVLFKVLCVRIKSGHGDSDYSETNVGGIKFSQSGGGTAFSNWVHQCLIQNNSVWFGQNVSDSVISECFVWGHVRNFAVRVDGGNIAVQNCPGIIPSQYNGGVYLTSTCSNPKVEGNFLDGGIVDSGHGIVASAALGAMVHGNQFWNCFKGGIYATDIGFWTVTGNYFFNCNRDNDTYHDVELVGGASGCAFNTFAHNSHVNNQTTANKGYCYKETNSSSDPTGNQFLYPIINTAYSTGHTGIISKASSSNSGYISQSRSGTWTPILRGSSTAGAHTYSTQTATYQIIGNMCFIQGEMVLTAEDGTAAGNLQIGGLPVAVGTRRATLQVGLKLNLASTYESLNLVGDAASSVLRVGNYDEANNWADVTTAAITNTSAICFSGFYFID